MRVLKAATLGLSIGFGTASAGLALPVTFTYTSNAVDLSGLEAWQRNYFDSAFFGIGSSGMVGAVDGLSASLSVRMDCDILSSGLDCVPVSHPPQIDSVVVLDANGSNRPSLPLQLTGISGFTESRVTVNSFRVGADSTVKDWGFSGTEYGMVGDFRLSASGDSWAFGGFHSAGPEEAYCYYAENSWYDQNTGLCENGTAVGYVGFSLDLGTGSWSSDLNTDLLPVNMPLPAGVPLVLTGLGILAYLKRRETV